MNCYLIAYIRSYRVVVVKSVTYSYMYVKDDFDTAIDNQIYSLNYCCICKLSFMNAWTDRQTKITYVCGACSDLLQLIA